MSGAEISPITASFFQQNKLLMRMAVWVGLPLFSGGPRSAHAGSFFFFFSTFSGTGIGKAVPGYLPGGVAVGCETRFFYFFLFFWAAAAAAAGGFSERGEVPYIPSDSLHTRHHYLYQHHRHASTCCKERES